MASVDLTTLTRNVEAVLRDPKATTVPTGNAAIDTSVNDLRSARMDGEYSAKQTLAWWG